MIVAYSNPYEEGYEVSIYDLSSKLLLRKMNNTVHFSLEKCPLQSGMYLLEVKVRRKNAKRVVEQKYFS